jgi:hypothetical protein
MSIEDVNFGDLDAETEASLLSYFIDTGVLGRLINGTKQYVIGRKGAGKTALFIKIDKMTVGHEITKLDFKSYSWEAHKRLSENGVPPESTYTGSWRFTFLLSIISEWTKTANGDLKKESARIMSSIYNKPFPKWYNFLFDKLKQVRQLTLPSVAGGFDLGGFELDGKSSDSKIANSISSWSSEILNFVNANYKDNPVSILVDKMDDGWDATKESKNMIIGALKAAKELNTALRLKSKMVPVLCFLRQDIYNELQFNDKNKISTQIEYLDWNEQKLVNVIEARIAASMRCNTQNAWFKAFTNKYMRQKSSIKSYITKRTMLRPRDVVAFCIFCREAAIDNNHKKIQTSDVYIAEEKYSNHIFDELDDEMHKQLPTAQDSLIVLKDMQKQRFIVSDWINAVKETKPQWTRQYSVERLKDLFDYSVVGIKKLGGAIRGTRFSFKYEDRLLKPDFKRQMVVHSSLKKVLSLKDRGA